MTDDREKIRSFIKTVNIDDLKKVQKYLEDNPLASVMDVCTNTGVSQSQVLQLVNSGILKLRDRDKTPPGQEKKGGMNKIL